MNDKDFEFQPQNGAEEGKTKAKAFWKNVGLVFLSLSLAVLTVLVLNLGK